MKWHRVTLPGVAVADEARPVTTITGPRPGPVLFVGAGVRGGEYPAVETVIRLSTALNAAEIARAVVPMPVVTLPAFWQRSSFVCPVNNVNPHGVFPGDPNGTYGGQMAHALPNAFVVQADACRDLHGGDIPETLVPLTICRAGNEPVDAKAIELTRVVGLPSIRTDDWWLYRSRATFTGRLEESSADSIIAGIPPVVVRRTGSYCANQIVNDRRCGSPN